MELPVTTRAADREATVAAAAAAAAALVVDLSFGVSAGTTVGEPGTCGAAPAAAGVAVGKPANKFGVGLGLKVAMVEGLGLKVAGTTATGLGLKVSATGLRVKVGLGLKVFGTGRALTVGVGCPGIVGTPTAGLTVGTPKPPLATGAVLVGSV